MSYQEEYDLIVKMIDYTQKQIEKNPKDRIFLEAELQDLQADLNQLRVKRNGKITCDNMCEGCQKKTKGGKS